MKKVMSVIFISIIIFSPAIAQKGIHSVGVGPSFGIPVSNKNFSYYYKNGIGASLQANFGVSKLGSVIVNVMHLSIGAKQLPVTGKGSLTLIKAGYRTNFLNSKFFVSADAGLAKYGSKSLESQFVINGTVGYSFRLSKESFIDLFSSYTHILRTPSNSMWLTANVLYRLYIKKKNKQ